METAFKCRPMDTKCMLEARSVWEKPCMNQRPPECDDDGYYKPVQCTSSNGLCRCVDKETGIPINSGGLESGVVQAQASDMDCLCAQNYHKAIQQGCLMSIDHSDYISDEKYRVRKVTCFSCNTFLIRN